MLPSDFRSITQLPDVPEDVVWHDLEPGFRQDCLNNLVELTSACQAATQNNPVSFYVGAGISYSPPSRLPVAYAVLTSILKLCRDQLATNERHYVDTALSVYQSGVHLQMETVLEQLYESVQPNAFHTGRIFDVPHSEMRSNLNHRFLARWLGSGRGTVVTTNLDSLIEHAWARIQGGQGLRVFKRPNEFENWKDFFRHEGVLWKLHGSADDAESWAITLPKVAFRLEDARRAFLDQLVREHVLCFIGYSASDIDLFPPILETQIQKGGNSPKVFWIFYFNEHRQTLDDYLSAEPNVRRLFSAHPTLFAPIVTTADRLSYWLETQSFSSVLDVKDWTADAPAVDYERWIKKDIDDAGYIGCAKLVGFTLRTLGQYEAAVDLMNTVAIQIINGATFASASPRELQQVAQLIQETAQTYWQHDNAPKALEQLDTAWALLSKADDALGRAWCQFGRVTMTLDAKHGVAGKRRAVAVFRLIALHYWFWRLARALPKDTSPTVGQGLCLYYETKILEAVTTASQLLRMGFVRKLLVRLYSRAETLLRLGGFPQSIPDIKRRRAIIRVVDEPERAVQDMIDAIRTARTVSRAHLELAVDRARQFMGLLKDKALIDRLSDEIDK